MKGYVKYNFTQEQIDKIQSIASEVYQFVKLPKTEQFGKVNKQITENKCFGGKKTKTVSEFKCLVPEHLKDYFKSIIFDENYCDIKLSEIGDNLLQLNHLVKVSNKVFLGEELAYVFNLIELK